MNWVLVLAGGTVIAVLIAKPLLELQRTAILVLLWAAGPYALLGVSSQIFGRSERSRRTGLLLSVTHFIVYIGLQLHFLYAASGSRGAFVFLLLPSFFWIFGLVSFFILLIISLTERHRGQPPGKMAL